jgi:Gram-negative bacterial TonB protein C-terminal
VERVSSAAAVALWLMSGVPAPAPVLAQQPVPSVETARTLYAAAAYDDALAMLTALPSESLDDAARLVADRYRLLCLLALGRSEEVDAVVTSILERDPSHRLDPLETSPRVQKAFLEARTRALPRLARQRYDRARARYAARDYAAAASDFGIVRVLLADPDLPAGEPAAADLALLAADFEALSRETALATERAAAETARAARVAAMAAEVVRTEPARADTARVAAPPPAPVLPPDPADGVYGAQHRDVVPPVVVRQEIRRWIGVPPPPAGTSLGEVQVVIDERGAVVEAAIVRSVSGFYDAVLMDSVRGWRYEPATRAGRPVRFRRVVALSAR